jgi:hypothetical protein
MANQAREYLTRRYTQSEDSRWTVTLVANIVRSLATNPTLTSNYLPTISLLRDRVTHSLALVKFGQTQLQQPNAREALDALDDVLEVSTEYIPRAASDYLFEVRWYPFNSCPARCCPT